MTLNDSTFVLVLYDCPVNMRFGSVFKWSKQIEM